ncbi:hypothetical protein DN051_35475 [Streptomyces cadmiisoli]|uniref:Uncharacterized protein n=1 Tax=Streptomyces cadmiisoli TaxID=2184053 RepID=A0A2Z4J850_9ACTN|nr:hypothetical protein DN051_35475 [Streptomyces cadmiisoli]
MAAVSHASAATSVPSAAVQPAVDPGATECHGCGLAPTPCMSRDTYDGLGALTGRGVRSVSDRPVGGGPRAGGRRVGRLDGD